MDDRPIVRLELTSDYICPWCYLGITRLDRIKTELSDEIDLEIGHFPYFLYPQIPKDGSPKEAFASKTKRGMGKALKMESEKEGISINYKKISKIPNSFEAHRCTGLIKDHELQWAFSKAIFQSYFEEGENIGDVEVLRKIALKVGVSKEEVSLFELREKGKEEVDQMVNQAKSNFISVVPTVNFDGKLSMSGLQEDILWKRFIKKAAVLQA